MQYNQFGNPVPETVADIAIALPDTPVKVSLYFRNSDQESDEYRYYAHVTDVETGDFMFDTQDFVSKDEAIRAFGDAGLGEIEDWTWRPDSMDDFAHSVHYSSGNLRACYHHQETAKAAWDQSNAARKTADQPMSTIWNLFTALKNEKDAEEMMDWPTFRYDFFEVNAPGGNPESVTISGFGTKKGDWCSRTLTIPLIVLECGMGQVEVFIKELCDSDREAFELSEYYAGSSLLQAIMTPHGVGVAKGDDPFAIDEEATNASEEPTVMESDSVEAFMRGLFGLPMVELDASKDHNDIEVVNWFHGLPVYRQNSILAEITS